MTPRTRPRPVTHAASRAAAVTVALVLCLAAGGTAAASEAGGAPGTFDTTRPEDAVTLTPASGTAGTTIAVRARCATETRRGTVFSPAFARPAVLHATPDGVMVAEATVRSGLAPDRGYVVTANCGAAESLNTTFAVAGAPPAGFEPAGAPRGPARQANAPQAAAAHGEAPGDSVDGVALAFGGGLAGAALAGYALIARRTSSRRRPRATSSTRRG